MQVNNNMSPQDLQTNIQVNVQKKAQDVVSNVVGNLLEKTFENTKQIEAMAAAATGKGNSINIQA